MFYILIFTEVFRQMFQNARDTKTASEF